MVFIKNYLPFYFKNFSFFSSIYPLSLLDLSSAGGLFHILDRWLFSHGFSTLLYGGSRLDEVIRLHDSFFKFESFSSGVYDIINHLNDVIGPISSGYVPFHSEVKNLQLGFVRHYSEHKTFFFKKFKCV